MNGDESQKTVVLVTTKPEAEIAADLKRRIEAALIPVCDLIDEAARAGFMVQWDGFGAQAPQFRHRPINLRLAKHY